MHIAWFLKYMLRNKRSGCGLCSDYHIIITIPNKSILFSFDYSLFTFEQEIYI